MELIVVKIISYLLLPPGLMFGCILIGLLLRIKWSRIGITLMSVGGILLLLCSLPVIMDPLLHTAEDIPALSQEAARKLPAQAIVVLGGGTDKQVPDYQADTVKPISLVRARYAVYLQRITKLPILTTGGSVYDNSEPEAKLMKHLIESEFGGTVNWSETQSRTTQQNAVYSFALLQKEHITQIILVTHALHMPRSQAIFEKVGFIVTPAPTGFHVPANEPAIMSILPHAYYIGYSRELVHEWLGRAWYKLRY